MSLEVSPQFSPELLDDFYAECDEQLTAIRQALVSLEGSIGMAQPDASAVEKLFRSFHSFKGNSSIIGLRPAENLAHSAEGFLRELSRGSATVTGEGLDLLMTATQRLEHLVANHREKKPLPEVSSLVEQIGRLSAQGPDSTRTAPEQVAQPELTPQVEEARARGLGVWLFRFTPSRQLDQRGVNVNSVRARLGELGEIIQARPHVRSDGSVMFEFIAALEKTPVNLSAWEEDGIIVEAFEQAAGAAPAIGARQTSPEPEAQGPFVAPSHIVRVDLSRLDDLMRITGEMVIHRARLEDQINRVAGWDAGIDTHGLQEVNTALARTVRELRESIMRVRLVPVAEIFARMPFVVRDLARESGKKVRLVLSGEHTEMDKYLIERLKDPLLHLVRNSLSHDIENPEERVAAGKPAQATVFLRASTAGDAALMEVGDDGRGIDVEAVTRRANKLGLQVPAALDDRALLELICAPGFSTRDEADRVAGRGVGMAVVSNVVRQLGGQLSVETQRHRGVRFCLRLPLTLAIADVFILSAKDQTCAVPQSFVQEVLQMTHDQVRTVNRTEVIPYRDGILPLVRLRAFFGVENSAQTRLPVLVLNSERGRTGLVVDRIHGQREVVVRAIHDPLIQVSGVAGATELGDGRPVLILDPSALTGGIVRPPDNNNLSVSNSGALALAI